MGGVVKSENKNAPVQTGEDAAIDSCYVNIRGHAHSHVIRVTGFYVNDYPSGPQHNIRYARATDWNCTKWSEGHVMTMDEFKRGYVLIDGPIEDWIARAIKALETGDISEYKDNSGEMNTTTALMGKDAKGTLIHVQNGLMAQQRKAEILVAMMGFEMERRKQALDKVRNAMMAEVEKMMKKVKKIMAVIDTIELYLGIHEELFHLQEGEPTSVDEPICFRQQLLYMDEEYGNPTDGGMDFKNIEEFDAWVLADKHYEKMIPEKKGIVIMNARRKNRVYSDNPFFNAMMNAENKKTYFLIRNGENLYRICSNIHIADRLFPRRDELQKIMEELNKPHAASWEKEKHEETVFTYQKRAVFLQGLLDRTQVFYPIKEGLSIFKMEENESWVKFIYDDEIALPTGRLPFWKWHEEINSTIVAGHRVIHSGIYNDDQRSIPNGKDYEDCFLRYYERTWPNCPSGGIYTTIGVERSGRQVTAPSYVIERMKKEGVVFYWIGTYKETKWEKGDPKCPPPLEGEKVEYFTHKQQTFEGKNLVTKETEYVLAYDYTLPVQRLAIKYNPKDKLYGGWGNYDPHIRKNNITFMIQPHDRYILNYERITLEDIDFYLNSRVDRKDYSEIIPLLYRLKDIKLKELADEVEFVKMMVGQTAGLGVTEKQIWDAIDWWKMKVIEKRSLTKDDAKAFRMILARLKSV